MSIDERQWCIFLPCGKGETWAVSHNAVAEIVAVDAVGVEPPEQLMWRGNNLAVFDPGLGTGTPWREAPGSTGHVAVLLGLEGAALEYWGVALRGEGLTIKDLRREVIEEAQDRAKEHAVTAFRLHDQLVQIPDFAMMQHQLQFSQ